MLTRLANGSYLDLSTVLAIRPARSHELGGDFFVPSVVYLDWGSRENPSTISVTMGTDDPQSYADELAELVAKAKAP